MQFTKMHGLGNDFIMINDMDNKIKNKCEMAKLLCDRHTGIGADGLIFIQGSEVSDLKMVIINSDGSEAEMCGNGIRCFCKYAYDKKVISKSIINVETLAGNYKCSLSIKDNNVEKVKVNMGSPNFNKNEITFLSDMDNKFYDLNVNSKCFNACTVLMGVPHTILFLKDDIDEKDIHEIGSNVEKMDIYPDRTNVNFVKVISKNDIYVRTWERGAGRTLACGTGCCASVVACCINNKTTDNVNVHLDKGILNIEYKNDCVYMDGPAKNVFEGEISIK